MNSGRYVRVGIFLVVIFAAMLAGAADVDFAPLFSRDTDAFGRSRARALGPFLEWNQASSGQVFWAAHPLYSALDDPDHKRSEANLLWPVWVNKQLDNQSMWQFMVLLYRNDYDVTDPDGRYKFVLFPFYFQGRGLDGKPYLAVVPIGGVIRDFLGWDETWFVLFPLTMYNRTNQAETRSWLWPIVSYTWGGGHDRFRVFPVYGITRFRMDYEKRFILWPFWSSVKYSFPKSSGSGYILFPLVGHLKLTDQETWMVVPPLTRFSKGTHKSEVNCPWPLFQWSSGEVDRLYFWPLWGHKTMAGNDSSFVLWPLYRQARRYGALEERARIMLMPILYYTSEHKPSREAPGQWDMVSRSLKVWPLFSSQSAPEGFHLNVLSLFPFMDYEYVERNYAALWTLYSHVSCGSVKEDELLWGLFRWRRAEAGQMDLSVFPLFAVDRAAGGAGGSWSLLKGLVGYKRAGEKKTFRVLYFLKF